MSWRTINTVLMTFFVLACTGGIILGAILSKNVPIRLNIPDTTQNDKGPAVNMNGLPVMYQPPQPLMNGARGQPRTLPIVDWRLNPKNRTAADIAALSSAVVQYHTTEGRTIKFLDDEDAQTIDPSQFSKTVINDKSAPWIGAFRREMQACRRRNFRDRPACLKEIRQLYCGGYQAWGRVDDCPAVQ